MWSITQAARERVERANLLVIPECDEEWTERDEEYVAYCVHYFKEIKPQLFTILPTIFHPAIGDGSINRRDIEPAIRTAYLQWQREQETAFHVLLDKASENKQHAISFMPKHVQQVFLDSLHDFRVMCVVYGEDSLQIDFDTSGGFSAKSFVSVTLTGIIAEENKIDVGDDYVYDELVKTDAGIAWRVLLNSDKQWTIEAKKWDAVFYFAPKTYFDFRDSEDFDGYVKTLDLANSLQFISPAVQSPIITLAPFCTKAGALTVRDAVYIGDVRVANTLADCIPFIHSEVYEDPHAIFSEPVATEDLMDFALGTDLENKVRAWNMMYAHPQALAPMINAILLQMDRAKEDEMLQFAYVNHFSKEGILNSAVSQKFRDIFE